MAQIHKLQVETAVKCSADKFYSTFKNNVNHLPKLVPETHKDVQVLEGDGKNVGTVRLWKNVVGGNTLHLKEKVEAVDDENRSMAFSVTGEDIINLYKTLTYKFDVNQTKGDECLVKWTLEFEKVNEDVAAPNMFLESTLISCSPVDLCESCKSSTLFWDDTNNLSLSHLEIILIDKYLRMTSIASRLCLESLVLKHKAGIS